MSSDDIKSKTVTTGSHELSSRDAKGESAVSFDNGLCESILYVHVSEKYAWAGPILSGLNLPWTAMQLIFEYDPVAEIRLHTDFRFKVKSPVETSLKLTDHQYCYFDSFNSVIVVYGRFEECSSFQRPKRAPLSYMEIRVANGVPDFSDCLWYDRESFWQEEADLGKVTAQHDYVGHTNASQVGVKYKDQTWLFSNDPDQLAVVEIKQTLGGESLGTCLFTYYARTHYIVSESGYIVYFDGTALRQSIAIQKYNNREEIVGVQALGPNRLVVLRRYKRFSFMAVFLFVPGPGDTRDIIEISSVVIGGGHIPKVTLFRGKCVIASQMKAANSRLWALDQYSIHGKFEVRLVYIEDAGEITAMFPLESSALFVSLRCWFGRQADNSFLLIE